MVDHFSRWQNALAIPIATAAVVTSTLDERVFCYLNLTEQMHTDRRVEFESQLMIEFYQLLDGKKDVHHTLPPTSQRHGVTE